MIKMIKILFDGPPGPISGCFVEVEDGVGNSLNAGEWAERSDGLWELRIKKELWDRIKNKKGPQKGQTGHEKLGAEVCTSGDGTKNGKGGGKE